MPPARWLQVLLLFSVIAALPSPSSAAERHLEFLEGLRARGFHDYALLYLDQLQARKDLPRDVVTALPYERAMTMLAAARDERNPNEAARLLDRAATELEEFARFYPDHPQAGRARSERGNILLEQARARIADSQAAGERDQRERLREESRSLLADARRIFETARDLHAAKLEKDKGYIDPDKEPERLQQRRQTEVDLVEAQERLGMCTYEEAQTHDANSPVRKDLLGRAAAEFKTIYDRYRVQYIGLKARLWEGKCYEEQGQLTEALGIYSEVLDGDRSKMTNDLLDLALEFRLICLNHPDKADHAVVVEDATRWLANDLGQLHGPQGLSIRWQRATAYEKLGEDDQLSGSEQQQMLRKALADAQEVNRFSPKLRAASREMIARLQTKLGNSADEPQNFVNAFEIAQTKLREIGDLGAAIQKSSDTAERRKLESDRELLLGETRKLLKGASALAGPDVDAKQRNQARYLLAYVQFLDGKSYEAGILAEFLARQTATTDPSLAQDSAWLAMAAFEQAASEQPDGKRDVELDCMLDAARILTTNWPEIERSNRARMTVGRILARNARPEEAAEWYSGIPESAPESLDASLAAGDAYWTSYVMAANRPVADRLPQAELDAWRQRAEERLRAGIARWEEKMTETDVTPGSLASARLTLAQICVLDGDYQEAVTILAGESRPVIAELESGEKTGEFTPAQRRQSLAFGYQLLLRAYVGLQQIDQALATMQKLEESAADNGGTDAVTPVYVELGRELEKEIRQLSEGGDKERLAEVRASFEQFLGQLFSRRQQMSAGSLRWMAETYRGLGEGMSRSAEATQDYFGKAADVYAEILDRDAAEAAFVSDEDGQVIRVRLAHCRRRKGDYEAAFTLLKDVLKQRPRSLDAQMEAAAVLQAWGGSGKPGAAGRTADAIRGIDADGIWGWSGLATRLRSLVATASGEQVKQYREFLLETRHNLLASRRQLALEASDAAERKTTLESAQRELQALVVVTIDIDDVWWRKFESIHHQLQEDLGQARTPLERPKALGAADGAPPEQPAADIAAPTEPQPVADSQPAAEPKTRTQWGMILIGAGLAALAAVLFAVFMTKPDRKRRARYLDAMRNASTPTAPAPSPAAKSPAKRPAVRKPNQP